MAKTEEPDPEEMGTWVNQARDEPMPASHHDDRGQSAVIRNEEHAEAHAAHRPGHRAKPCSPPRPSSPPSRPSTNRMRPGRARPCAT